MSFSGRRASVSRCCILKFGWRRYIPCRVRRDPDRTRHTSVVIQVIGAISRDAAMRLSTFATSRSSRKIKLGQGIVSQRPFGAGIHCPTLHGRRRSSDDGSTCTTSLSLDVEARCGRWDARAELTAILDIQTVFWALPGGTRPVVILKCIPFPIKLSIRWRLGCNCTTPLHTVP